MRRPDFTVRALRCLPALLLLATAAQAAARLRIVAAENFYADIAGQVAGGLASTGSILSNPDEDPHLFEASPSVARALADADIVIQNGAEYDPWMQALLAASPSPSRQLIDVAALLHVRPGANPHLWYDPRAMRLVSGAIAGALARADPAGRGAVAARLAGVQHSLDQLDGRVAILRQRYAGTLVTATEPIFGYMSAALGLTMLNQGFQLAVMNNTEPSPGDVAAFEADLRGRRVKLLIYNSQATRLNTIARASRGAVIGVTETEPAGATYQSWTLDQLDALDRALSAAPQ